MAKLYIAQIYGKVIEGELQINVSDSGISSVEGFSGININTDNGTLKIGEGKNLQFYQLGVQTRPGIQMQLNGGAETTRIGQTGIFELNLGEDTPISAISFPNLAINLSASDINYILVDLVYSYAGGE